MNDYPFVCWIKFIGNYGLYFFSFSVFALSISDLTLEEKVGQVLMVHFHGSEANEEAERLIKDIHVGGIIYYTWANELKDPPQILHLSQSLQNLAQQTSHSLPLFIAIDQEGGRVNRLKKGFTHFPGNYALGITGEWLWGKESAKIVGQELKAVGISLNLAPVIDIFTHPENDVIGIRAFSSEPSQVALWGKYALQGYKKAGVIAALKHFPGHGDVAIDSHEALPTIAKSREELERVELVPFRSLAGQAEVMLTGHLFLPALDSQHCTTFSKKIVEDFLRKELGFHGVIMTDSLAMEGIRTQCSSLEEAVLNSLNAGHDLILLGGKQLLFSQNGLEYTIEDVARIHRYLVDAVKKGWLSESRLNESVNRILDLKQRYGLFDFKSLNLSLANIQVAEPSHLDLANQIAKRALQLIKGKEHLPLSFQTKQPLLVIAPECLREDLSQTMWSDELKFRIFYFKNLNPNDLEDQRIKTIAANYNQCVYFASHLHSFENQRKLLTQIREIVPFLVGIATSNPLDAEDLTNADVILCTSSPIACSLQMAFEYLNGK